MKVKVKKTNHAFWRKSAADQLSDELQHHHCLQSISCQDIFIQTWAINKEITAWPFFVIKINNWVSANDSVLYIWDFYLTPFGGRVYKWKFCPFICPFVCLSVITSYLTDQSLTWEKFPHFPVFWGGSGPDHPHRSGSHQKSLVCLWGFGTHCWDVLNEESKQIEI